MVKDKNFGAYVHQLREKRNVVLEVLADGVCDFAKLSRIENGKVEAEKLLRDRLLGRLGVAPENYENFLYYSEYKGWRERQDIVQSILHRRLQEARILLGEYKNTYSMEKPLEYQFYLSMWGQIRRLEGADKKELCDIFQEALQLTVGKLTREELKKRMLSVEEMNLLLEYVFCSEEESLMNWCEGFLAYIKKLQLDKLALSKIYPKAVYYLYLEWKDTVPLSKAEISKMLHLCNKAIEVLQNGNRMFYFWELLEAKEWLLQCLIDENKEKGENVIYSLKQLQEKCIRWRETLEEVYEEYGVSKEMQEFCYVYTDMEAYCIGDVIRIRRKMLGMTMQELCDGICSERTISRLERNMTEPQREIVRLLFERLHMASEFCRNDLLTENPEAKRLFGELKQCNNQMECERAEQLLSQVKGLIDLEIPENRQAVFRNELILECNKKKLEGNYRKELYIPWIKEILEYTIPYEVATAKGEKYITQTEISCLQNIMGRVGWRHPEMKECVDTLYELFEHQRRMEECMNMYEFVMLGVSSCLGDKGEYDLSDDIKIKVLKNALLTRRLGEHNRSLYGLLWNDEQRKKEQHPVRRGVDVKKELQKCICFCEMSNELYHIRFYEKKITDGV